MSTCKLVFQCASSLKIQLSLVSLAQWTFVFISLNATCSRPDVTGTFLIWRCFIYTLDLEAGCDLRSIGYFWHCNTSHLQSCSNVGNYQHSFNSSTCIQVINYKGPGQKL